MRPEHHTKRVEFEKWALEEYGSVANGSTKWGKLINTDFSAMVKQHGNFNTKNHAVWGRSTEELGEMLDFHQEKFDGSFMLWG